MKIGILSDTHGDLPGFLRAIDTMGPCDYYLHAGDVLAHGTRGVFPGVDGHTDLASVLAAEKNIYFARGNCDFDTDEIGLGHDLSQNDRVIELDGLTFYLTHGHRDTYRERVAKAKRAGADVLIYGHSHRKELFREDNLTVVNPAARLRRGTVFRRSRCTKTAVSD